MPTCLVVYLLTIRKGSSITPKFNQRRRRMVVPDSQQSSSYIGLKDIATQTRHHNDGVIGGQSKAENLVANLAREEIEAIGFNSGRLDSINEIGVLDGKTVDLRKSEGGLVRPPHCQKEQKGAPG